MRLITTEEGRAASKSSHSADIIPYSAVGIFSPKTEGTKT
jgi:hypothetical protein